MKIHVAQPTHDALQELGGFQLERRQDDVISVRVLVQLITCIPAKYHDCALVTHWLGRSFTHSDILGTYALT